MVIDLLLWDSEINCYCFGNISKTALQTQCILKNFRRPEVYLTTETQINFRRPEVYLNDDL